MAELNLKVHCDDYKLEYLTWNNLDPLKSVLKATYYSSMNPPIEIYS